MQPDHSRRYGFVWVVGGYADFNDQVSVNNQLEISTHRILIFPILSIQFYILSEIIFPGLTEYLPPLYFGNGSHIFLIVITFLFYLYSAVSSEDQQQLLLQNGFIPID
jgi:hypothetical protein